MRLLDSVSGHVLCAFCGDVAEEMAVHLETAHVKELSIINSNYQAPGNPVSRWIFEVRNLPVPHKLISSAQASPDVQPIPTVEENTTSGVSSGASTPSMISASSVAVVECEEMCQECCKMVDDRQRHLYVHHVKRPIVKCPLCSFSSHFDATKVEAHIVEAHSEVKEELEAIDQSHLYQEEIARWEARCFGAQLSGPPELFKITESVSSYSQSLSEKEIISSMPLQADDCAVLLQSESMSLRNRQYSRKTDRDKVEENESVQQKKNVESPMEEKSGELEKMTMGAIPEEIHDNIQESRGAEKSAGQIRQGGRCEMCPRPHLMKDVEELKRHAVACRAERPLPCAYCPRRFQRRSDYTLHRRNVHEKNDDPHSLHTPPVNVNDSGSANIACSRRTSENADENEAMQVNQTTTASSAPSLTVRSGVKLSTTSFGSSSPLAVPTVDQNNVSHLQEAQDNTQLNRKDCDEMGKKPLNLISPTKSAVPLTLRKSRRQRAKRLVEEDDRNDDSCGATESPMDERVQLLMEAGGKRRRRQPVKSAIDQPDPVASSAKRKTMGATKKAGRPQRGADCEEIAVKNKKQTLPSADTLLELKATAHARLRSSLHSGKIAQSSTTTEAYSLDAAQQATLSPEEFECSECVERFATRAVADEHRGQRKCLQHLRRLRALQRSAGDGETVRCELCNERLAWTSAAAHIYSHCKPYKCSQCAEEYSSNIPVDHFRLICMDSTARCIDLRPELEAELTAVVRACFAGCHTSPYKSLRRHSRRSTAG